MYNVFGHSVGINVSEESRRYIMVTVSIGICRTFLKISRNRLLGVLVLVTLVTIFVAVVNLDNLTVPVTGPTSPRKAGTLLHTDALNRSRVISDARIVVIVAYMRTGSTLVGKLLEQHPGTFYLFEPIRAVWTELQGSRDKGAVFKYLDGHKRHFSFADLDDVVRTELVNWVTCRLDLQSVMSLTDEHHSLFTTTMKQFHLCSRPYFLKESRDENRTQPMRGDLPSNTDRQSNIDSCLRHAQASCKSSSLIALKFVRLRMHQIEPLLSLFPNMKIIHLNRDPRGMINSRIRLKLFRNASLENDAHYICSEMSNDLSISKSILKKYPGRLKIIEYEDLADSPVSTAEKIYKFIGINFTEEVRHFVKTMTSSNTDTCTYCTERKNSTKTASRWRLEMGSDTEKFKVARVFQETCRHSNRLLGYLPFESASEMLDTLVPSREYVNVEETLLSDGNI